MWRFVAFNGSLPKHAFSALRILISVCQSPVVQSKIVGLFTANDVSYYTIRQLHCILYAIEVYVLTCMTCTLTSTEMLTVLNWLQRHKNIRHFFSSPFSPRCIVCNVVFLIVEPSVCLSVCPSHAWIVTKRTKVPLTFLYPMKGKNFSDTKNGWWWTPPCTWNFGSNPASFKNGYFQLIFARTASGLTPSKKFNYD